jgi:phage terminase large subunit-like protein
MNLTDIAHLIPGYDPWRDSAGWEWNPAPAERALEFFDEVLTFADGPRAGQPFQLEDWQKAIVVNLYGWWNGDRRRYREAMVMVPRKNGKTPTLAGLMLHEMVCHPTPGGQYYSAAADRDQAALIYRDAAKMVGNDDLLSSLFSMTPSSKLIQRKDSGQFFKALSSEAHTKHGLRPCFVAVDELHAHPNAELVDTLTTGTAVKGMQPLVIYITTSDYNRDSVCNTKYKYACGVRDGRINDPAFLPVIYEALKTDDWTSPEVWKRANPNYGISVSEEYLARECERAKVEPSYANTFKRLHLNIQTESVEAWFRMDQWDACGEEFAEEMLRNNDCFGGLDMSSTSDVTAFVLYFPDGGYVLAYFWLPGETAEARQRKDGVPYTEWTGSGLIQETDKNHIDDDAIFDKICELGMTFNIRQIAFDGWQAAAMFNRLAKHGFDAVKFPQTINMMNSPSKRLESMLANREIRHGGNPVLRWMATNTVKEQDNRGFIRPSKKHSSEKIDGIAALVMAIGAADATPDNASVYQRENRGFLEIG